MSSCTLVAVAGGATYHRYAMELMRSAREHFRPCEHVSTLILEGEEGWPIGTVCRHGILAEAMPETDWVFLVDADMRFEQAVDDARILPKSGIVATEHPGYVGKGHRELPYDRRPESPAFMAPDEGVFYYAGGFVGGTREAMHGLSSEIAQMLAEGVMPVFHDESCLNRLLWESPPTVLLDPSFCHPDSDSYYRQAVWQRDYPRRLVALDKAASERVGR